MRQLIFSTAAIAARSCRDQGLTAAEMKRCHWVKPVTVCQFKFTKWTLDDRLRQPAVLGIREDKNASEVLRKKASQMGSRVATSLTMSISSRLLAVF